MGDRARNGGSADELRSNMQRQELLDRLINFVDEDNEKFLRKIRERIDRVGIDTPKVEIRYENLSVEGEGEDAYAGHIPSLFNATCNSIKSALRFIGIVPTNKKKVKILESVTGIVKPSRLTLLLGPPGAGKTTFLLALAGKLDRALKVSGNVSYCGHQLSEFIPQRTCAYISPHNLHSGEMTVRETLDFSGRCLGVGPRNRMLKELLKREKQAGIEPDPDIDAFMKATAVPGQETSLITDYIIKIFGLETCADAMVGDQMIRGISGGEKKRVTTGEMLVGPARVLFMDEISNGLDSSTKFNIIKVLRQMVHIMDLTMVISLLQPDPETYKLFDDVILISEGQIVYQGPCQHVLEFLECMGFKCPERKGVADFLQEVTSRKDQEQYWYKTEQPYCYITISEFTRAFKSFHIGQKLATDIRTPFDKSKTHPDALVKDKYGISNLDLLKVCFHKEWLLTKRNYGLYIFKIFQLTFMSLVAMAVFFRTEMHVGSLEDGGMFFESLFFGLLIVMFNGMAELVLTIMRLPMFYKHRDSLLYPAWAFALPIWVLKIPLSLMESGIWVGLTYYTIGYAPDASRFFKQYLTFFAIHQMALSLFRVIAAVARTDVLANTMGVFTSLVILVLGGFIVSKNDTKPWVSWGFYASPMMYAQNALVLNEFLDKRWSAPNIYPQINASTVGEALLKSRGFFTEDYWFYFSIGVLIGFSCLFNMLFITALTFLNPITDTKAAIKEEVDVKNSFGELNQSKLYEGAKMGVKSTSEKIGSTFCCADRMERRGMVLPFQPLSLAFNHVNYFIDVPGEMKARGVKDDRLQLLKDVSGAFRPGILTALTGVSGAGKTTLMDVLAGRKTGGYIEGSIFLSGFPKNQATFARVSGYCEQNDIHTPNVTVHESLLYSAWLRLSSDERGNQELIREIITPLTGSKDLVFRTKEKLQDLVSMLGAFHSAVVFLGAINQNGVQPIVAVERTVFYRERAAGMYSSLPYALAQVTIESIYIACQTCIYVCLLYPTIGFQWTTAKFLWFYYYMLTSIIYFTMFGMMIISLTPSPQISAVIIYFFICLWNLFSGFIIPRPHIPIWSRWYYWGNPLSWTIYGLLTSQVGQQDLMFEVPGAGNVTVEGFMKKEFGFEYDFLPIVAAAHIGWILVFFFIFVCGIKYLNFQQR